MSSAVIRVSLEDAFRSLNAAALDKFQNLSAWTDSMSGADNGAKDRLLAEREALPDKDLAIKRATFVLKSLRDKNDAVEPEERVITDALIAEIGDSPAVIEALVGFVTELESGKIPSAGLTRSAATSK